MTKQQEKDFQNYHKTNLLSPEQKKVVLKEFKKLDLNYETLIFFAFNNEKDYKILKLTNQKFKSVIFDTKKFKSFGIENHLYTDIFVVHNHPNHIFPFPSVADHKVAKSYDFVKHFVFGSNEIWKREKIDFVEINDFFNKSLAIKKFVEYFKKNKDKIN